MSALPAGTRIRMKGTVWPERAGCEGVVVVAPNGRGMYPDDPRDKSRVVVLLDDDPLAHRYMISAGQGWTCAVSRADLDVIA